MKKYTKALRQHSFFVAFFTAFALIDHWCSIVHFFKRKLVTAETASVEFFVRHVT
jgi:hypothetical protein